LKILELIELERYDMPMNPGVATEYCKESILHYPDPRSVRLKDEIAKYYQLKNQQVMVARNASELFELILQSIKCKDVMVVEPASPVFHDRCRINSIREHFFLLESNDWPLAMEALFSALHSQVDCLVLSNPAYLNCESIPQTLLQAFLQKLERKNLFLILDETSLDLSEKLTSSVLFQKDRRLLVMRSLKFQDGTSLCFGLSPRRFIEKIQEYQMNWSVPRLLEEKGLELLQKRQFK
jgi:histidinol-phosphate/aromatic aminotransferase/cobyric acid decarboxylase-like protein